MTKSEHIEELEHELNYIKNKILDLRWKGVSGQVIHEYMQKSYDLSQRLSRLKQGSTETEEPWYMNLS